MKCFHLYPERNFLTLSGRRAKIISLSTKCKCVDGDKTIFLLRAESRRVVQGGAGSFGYWPLSGRAETTVGPDGCPPLPGQRFAAKSRSCEWLVLPAKRVVPRVPCNRTYRLSSLRGFRPLRDGSLFSFEQQTYPLRRFAPAPPKGGGASNLPLRGRWHCEAMTERDKAACKKC